jgi:YVTN family beta-propeller protein
LRLHGVPPPCLTCAVLVILSLCWASAAVAQPLAYVLGDRTGTNDLVTVIDTATGTKLGGIPVGQGGPTLNGGGIAASPDGSRAYVVNSVDRTVSVISTLTNTVLGTIGLGQSATSIAVSPDGSRLYVGHNSVNGGPTVIRVISTTSGATIGTIQIASLPVFATFGIAVSADGRRLYATAWTGFCSSQAVKVIDTASGAVVPSIGTPPFPGAIALARRHGGLRLAHRHGRGNGGADRGGAVRGTRAEGTRPKAESRRQKAKGKEAELQTRGRRQNPEPRTQNL